MDVRVALKRNWWPLIRAIVILVVGIAAAASVLQDKADAAGQGTRSTNDAEQERMINIVSMVIILLTTIPLGINFLVQFIVQVWFSRARTATLTLTVCKCASIPSLPMLNICQAVGGRCKARNSLWLGLSHARMGRLLASVCLSAVSEARSLAAVWSVCSLTTKLNRCAVLCVSLLRVPLLHSKGFTSMF